MHLLDQPIWNALKGPQANLAESTGSARRFPPAVTTLGALAEVNDEGFASIASLQKPGEVTALFLHETLMSPHGWKIVHTAPLAQMIYEGGDPARPANRWAKLGPSDGAEMLALAQLTQPGPFGTRT